ncbi:MAG: leucine-rich repeat domain-containing protein, partial [Oscillospiraceae bacterium]|nr:leucine-rich repeat domain-containing protein [Oscillospiraceae bacterium]
TIPECVTSIGERAFYDCTELQSVVIPEGVKEISGFLFRGCAKLQSVTIPESVQAIGKYAFCDCGRLKSVTIPKGVKAIGKFAFRGCHWRMTLIAPYFPISDIEKDDKLKACCGFARAYLGNAAPDEEISAGYLRYIKSQRKKLYIDAIADGALLHLLFAARLVQPKDIEDLMGYKAYFHKDTEALIQEYRVRYLGPADPVKEAEQKKKAAEKSAKSMEEFETTGVMTLAEAEKLFNIKREKGNVIITRYKNYTSPDADVVIPWVIGKSPVTGINMTAFSGNENIRSVTIPEGVKTIGQYAFSGCSNLQSVTLPKGLREMDLCVFADCKRLESVTIPGSLKYIPE